MSDEWPEHTTGSKAARENREAMQRKAQSSLAAPTGSAEWARRQMELADLNLQSRARRLGAHWYGVKDCETYETRMNDLKLAAIAYAYAVEVGILPPPKRWN